MGMWIKMSSLEVIQMLVYGSAFNRPPKYSCVQVSQPTLPFYPDPKVFFRLLETISKKQ